MITRASGGRAGGVGDECFGSGADDDPSPGEIPAGCQRRLAMRFNQGQVALGRKTSRSGQIPDPCVEVEDRRRIVADKLRHASEQRTNEVAIALKKGTNGHPERNRQLDSDFCRTPTTVQTACFGEGVEAGYDRAQIVRSWNPCRVDLRRTALGRTQSHNCVVGSGAFEPLEIDVCRAAFCEHRV